MQCMSPHQIRTNWACGGNRCRGVCRRGEWGGYASAGGAVEEADLDEEGFVDLLQRVLLFGQGGGECVEADRDAVVLLDDGAQEAAIELVEAVGVDLEAR